MRSDNGLFKVLSCRVGACKDSRGNELERMGIESSNISELRKHSAPRATEAPRSIDPRVLPVSRSLTTISASAPSTAERRRIRSLRDLSRKVLRIRSTPG